MFQFGRDFLENRREGFGGLFPGACLQGDGDVFFRIGIPIRQCGPQAFDGGNRGCGLALVGFSGIDHPLPSEQGPLESALFFEQASQFDQVGRALLGLIAVLLERGRRGEVTEIDDGFRRFGSRRRGRWWLFRLRSLDHRMIRTGKCGLHFCPYQRKFLRGGRRQEIRMPGAIPPNAADHQKAKQENHWNRDAHAGKLAQPAILGKWKPPARSNKNPTREPGGVLGKYFVGVPISWRS